jgi:hypothetical protein
VVAQEFHGAARWNHVPLYRNENLQIWFKDPENMD